MAPVRAGMFCQTYLFLAPDDFAYRMGLGMQDHLTVLAAYDSWVEARKQGRGAERKFGSSSLTGEALLVPACHLAILGCAAFNNLNARADAQHADPCV